MDRFVTIFDLVSIITKESACIQFLFDEELLHTTMRCSECNAHLRLNYHKEVRMAICPNNRRDAQILYDLVSKHLELTSTIHTDAWRGYNGLFAGSFANHLTVNHSLHFVDPITHVHTNNIESHLRSLRHRRSSAKPSGFSHFGVFMAPGL